MTIAKTCLLTVFFVLCLTTGNTITAAVDIQTEIKQALNNTVMHLEAGRQALQANQLETAQEHIKAAGQSAKNIIGGSYEVKAQHGSRAISTARRQIKEGNTDSAAISLKQAIEIFKSLLDPNNPGGRGGLN